MFGIIVGDYYLVKKQHVVIEDLYSMSPSGPLFYDNGWNRKALLALAISGAVPISMALLGAYGVIPNVGDWGWLIGAVLGALVHTLAMTKGGAVASVPAE